MGLVERVSDLAREDQRFVQRNGPIGNPLRKRGTLDELHDDEWLALDGTDFVNRTDVRMVQSRRMLRFRAEPQL
jgi:hypothetical protein